jgi:membrane-associated protease RseP (regulator of RpoE activity)
MDEGRGSADGPPIEEIESVFRVDETVRDGETLYYLGTPLASSKTLERQLWPLFRDAGYKIRLRDREDVDAPVGIDGGSEPATAADRATNGGPLPTAGGGFPQVAPRYVLIAEPRTAGIDGIPWANVAAFLLTVLSTLWVGTQWYYIDVDGPADLLGAWPFTAAILGVLAVHEFGHYVLIRYHDVDASLPYFIPIPTIIGTMGAVIRMRGRIPSRKALFDIGVAGPLAGLVATVVVTVIGLHLDPITVPERILESEQSTQIVFHYPLLLQGLAALTGQPLAYADPSLSTSPVVFGGWVGMFVTFQNLLPAGQTDGGHITRAMLGPRQETLAAGVPFALFGLAGYLFWIENTVYGVGLWVVWGVFTTLLAYSGPATPIHDDPIDRRRLAVGAVTFLLGALCFVPVPFEIIPPA